RLVRYDKAQVVCIAESERSCDLLIKEGLQAVAVGGANNWRSEWAIHFAGFHVVILRDNDEPGLKLANQIIKDLLPLADSVTLADGYLKGLSESAGPDNFLEHRTAADLLQIIKQTPKVGNTAEDSARPPIQPAAPAVRILLTAPSELRRPLAVIDGRVYTAF